MENSVNMSVIVLALTVAVGVVVVCAACVGVVWLCIRLLLRYQAVWGSATAFIARQAVLNNGDAYGNMAATDATATGMGELSVHARDGARERPPRSPSSPVSPTADDLDDMQ